MLRRAIRAEIEREVAGFSVRDAYVIGPKFDSKTSKEDVLDDFSAFLDWMKVTKRTKDTPFRRDLTNWLSEALEALDGDARVVAKPGVPSLASQPQTGFEKDLFGALVLAIR